MQSAQGERVELIQQLIRAKKQINIGHLRLAESGVAEYGAEPSRRMHMKLNIPNTFLLLRPRSSSRSKFHFSLFQL
ncbi:MAG TPA: hypothetical protein VFH28_00500 [Nitrososphaera sp.]|nr:hypothetical protein [Nitrososphaera sp.]